MHSIHTKEEIALSHYERLYDEVEQSQVRYIGFTSETNRYDFGIVYTNMFFGKTLVVDMQTGRSALLCENDVDNVEYLQKLYNIDDYQEAEGLADFFKGIIPALPQGNQY